MSTLKAGISGIRGIWKDSLTPADVERAAWDIVAWIRENKMTASITLGGDPRPSTATIRDILTKNLIEGGINILDVGTAPTPTIQFLTKKLQTGMGVAVTASHNPIQWNGWKLIRQDGLFFLPAEMKAWIENWKKAKRYESENEGTISLQAASQFLHLDRILEIVDVGAIRARRLRVAVDCCNGAGSLLLPRLLATLGCDVIPIHTDPTQPFPRNPEPLPENLGALANAVKANHADIGFAQDADADRLAIVNNLGEPIGEEMTLALAVQHVLKKGSRVNSPKVVINLSTSQTTEDVARELGAEVIRTPVGEIQVVQEMVAVNALIGGEGNGGVIYPAVGFARDSLTAAALILERLSQTTQSIAEIVEGFPKYHSFRKKIPIKDSAQIPNLLQNAKQILQEAGAIYFDERDGVWAKLAHGWVHVRGSNTEPIVRIMGEGKTQEDAVQLLELF